MRYVKHLKNGLLYGGLIFGISLLQFGGIDFYACILALLSFLILFIHDSGKEFIGLTNQSEKNKYAFGALVNPLLAVICLQSLFYVSVGEMHRIFWMVSGFLAFILLVIDGAAWLEKGKK